ncbi:MAG TPA: hypothetical protein VLA92_05050 [Candidatus Saccharimonadales bacterium]|nr:hypothetical protein [Candidatus Saccharimonadales bacterium]
MNILRRQPEVPAVYEASLAYSVAYSWGGLYVTDAASETYRMAPLEAAKIDLEERTFAARSLAKTSDAMRFDILLASPDEHVLENEVSVESPVGSSVMTKRGLEAVLTMATDEDVELSINAGFAEMHHHLQHELGEASEDIAFHRIGKEGTKRVTEQSMRDYARQAHKATTVANFAQIAVHERHAEWHRNDYASRRLKDLRGKGAAIFGGAAILLGANVALSGNIPPNGLVLPGLLVTTDGYGLYANIRDDLRAATSREETLQSARVDLAEVVGEDLLGTYIEVPDDGSGFLIAPRD